VNKMAKRYEDINGVNKPKVQSKISALRSKMSEASGGQPDWSRVDGDWLRMIVNDLTKDDGAVLLGYSRDGGAYAVTIFDGDSKEKLYVHSDTELMALFQEIHDEYGK